MCHYTQVGYSCGHCRYTVREWCESYETTHKRCPLHVVAIEKRTREICSSCAPPPPAPWMDQIHMTVPPSESTRRTQDMYARQPRQTMASSMGMQYLKPRPIQHQQHSGGSWGCV